MATATVPKAPKMLGPIERGVVYPYPEFLKRSGLGRKAVSKLRREGMPIRKAGRSQFIVGDDFLEALNRRQPKAEANDE